MKLGSIIQCVNRVSLKTPKPVPISTEFDLRFYRYVKCIGQNRKSFRLKYWNQHFIPLKYSPRFEKHNFNIWIHFKNASRYADLGILLKHWPMAESKASRNLFVTTSTEMTISWKLCRVEGLRHYRLRCNEKSYLR